MTNPILKDGERIDQLFSTDVKIIQNKEVFSYSIDSVLLSRFPKIPKKVEDEAARIRKKYGNND